MRDCIVKLGEDHIGKTKGWEQSKPWWNEEVKEKYAEYKGAKKDMRKRCDHGKVERFTEAKHNFLESYHRSKQDHLEKTIKSLDGDERNMWKAVKKFNNAPDEYVVQPLTDNNGNILSDDAEIANEFSANYGDTQVRVETEQLQKIREQHL